MDELFATLSLGKIRPTPKGIYKAEDKYSYLDIVTYGGEGYICSNIDGAEAGYIKDTRYWQKFAERGESALRLSFATRDDYENSNDTKPVNSALVKTIIDSLSTTITTIQTAINAINLRLDRGTVNNANTVGGRTAESFSCVNSCSWTCLNICIGSCNNSCLNGCVNTCADSCISGCTGTCTGGCVSGCANLCVTGCTGTCKGSCNTSCTGSCDARG